MNELEEVKAERDALGRMLHDKSVKLQRTIEQRDMLWAALDDLIHRPFKPGTRPGDAQRDKARAALKEAK